MPGTIKSQLLPILRLGNERSNQARGHTKRDVAAKTLTSFGIRNVRTTLDSLRNQPYSVANLLLTNNFHISEGKRIQIRAEALNAFNHPYFGAGMGLNPGTAAAPNAAFGLVTTQRNNPRDIQFGAKFIF